jgi:uncharacterized protein YndB with AHSA1/START domain
MGDADDQWVDVRVLTADRPNLLELAWDFPGESSTVLRVRFEAIDADRTRLVLDHNNSTWEQRFDEYLPAWRERAAQLTC